MFQASPGRAIHTGKVDTQSTIHSIAPQPHNTNIKVPRPSGPNYWKFFNGNPMFSVKNIVQNVKHIELRGKHLVPLHFVISKS